MSEQIDPLVLDILWTRLTAMVNEQASGLQRTAFSHLVREAGDLSVGIFDARGRLTVQAVTGTPGHIFALPATVETLLELFPWSDLEPGDVLVTNDPYIGCGHQYDVSIVTPIFGPTGPVAIYGSTAHVVDIGGRHSSGDGTDVFEEGLRIPPTKLFRAGALNQDLVSMIKANVRSPDEVTGDIYALVGTNEVGGRALVAYMSELGHDDFDSISEQIIVRSRRATSAAIKEVPDGEYSGEIVSDGVADEDEIRIAVTLRVAGDQIEVDFDGSSPPSSKGINVVFNYSRAYAAFSLKCALTPEAPNNHGSLGPITIKAPTNSLLNAQEPAPVSMRHVVGHLIPGAVFDALAKAVPDRVIAEGSGAAWVTSALIPRSGEKSTIASWVNAGGMGARPNKDGLSCTSFPTGTRAVPIEILESSYPLIVHRREIMPDSGGAGRFRGGCGQTITFEISSADGGSVGSSTDRISRPAVGASGGGDGMAGAFYSDKGPMESKGSNRIAGGERVTMRLPGGAGLGPAITRPPAMVLRDVVAGYVSADAAERDYGVVIDPDSLAIDANATDRLRKELAHDAAA